MHFVATALPKAPTHALRLGDRTSAIDVAREVPEGSRRKRNSSAAAPLVRCVGVYKPRSVGRYKKVQS
jgi:hypothetical protein